MHVMIDLETMGTDTLAPIVAIGAVLVDIHADDPIIDKFYVTVDLASSVRAGAVISPDTVMWWMSQSEEARKALYTGEVVTIEMALQLFTRWISSVDQNIEGIWGNGVDFDNAILKASYERSCFPVPWNFWENRCYRTLKNLFPHIPADTYGTAHNALDDAIKQGRHLATILRTMTTYNKDE